MSSSRNRPSFANTNPLADHTALINKFIRLIQSLDHSLESTYAVAHTWEGVLYNAAVTWVNGQTK